MIRASSHGNYDYNINWLNDNCELEENNYKRLIVTSKIQNQTNTYLRELEDNIGNCDYYNVKNIIEMNSPPDIHSCNSSNLYINTFDDYCGSVYKFNDAE